MNIQLVRSDKIYKKIMLAEQEKKADIYRYELMKPFEKKWACYHVPLKASHEGGYDVVMATGMLGCLTPDQVDASQKEGIEHLADDQLWTNCKETIQMALTRFTKLGYELPVQDYTFSLVLANPKSPYVSESDGYAGDGGIPGYLSVSLVPNDYTISRIQVALAHECNHNVRFQFEKWRDEITLAEMMIAEGLAENFATMLFGEEMVGPWVSKTDLETLNQVIKPIIKGALDVQGSENITAYLYGDKFAALQNYFPVGLPYCAGYACGYAMIKYYLKKTGKSIEEATLTPANEIMKEIEDFWD